MMVLLQQPWCEPCQAFDPWHAPALQQCRSPSHLWTWNTGFSYGKTQWTAEQDKHKHKKTHFTFSHAVQHHVDQDVSTCPASSITAGFNTTLTSWEIYTSGGADVAIVPLRKTIQNGHFVCGVVMLPAVHNDGTRSSSVTFVHLPEDTHTKRGPRCIFLFNSC